MNLRNCTSTLAHECRENDLCWCWPWRIRKGPGPNGRHCWPFPSSPHGIKIIFPSRNTCGEVSEHNLIACLKKPIAQNFIDHRPHVRILAAMTAVEWLVLLHHRKPLMKSCMSVTLVIGPFIFPKVSRIERNTRRWTYSTSTPAVCKLGFLKIKRSSSFCKSQTSSVISMCSQSPEVTGQRYRIPAISEKL